MDDDQLRDMAASACQEALAFGVSEDAFLRLARSVREKCAKVNRDRAMKMEAEAQRAADAGEHDEVSALRSTAWQLTVAEREILGA